MNRYPLWKYLIILVALSAGIVFTIPNFFGESPAIQISPLRATAKVDVDLLNKVDSLLADNSVSVQAAYLDSTGVKVRFQNTDAQLKAKDIVQDEFGEDFVVALNLLSNSPRWLASFNALPMYLGLDLRGGVHFLLEVDIPSSLEKARESYVQDLRQLMRAENIRYSKISINQSNIDIEFREATIRDKAIVELDRKSPD